MCARLSTLIALGASVLGPQRLFGQSAGERAVRAVVDSFFAAVAREKWDSAAALIDLTRFEPYFKEQVSNARSALPQREMTVEDMMAGDSTMPRAVAEWEIARTKRYRGFQQFGDVSYEFAGVRTQHELFALTVPEAASRWIEAQDERTQMREALRRMGCSLASIPMEIPGAKRTVLATALGNDSTAYVVHTDDRFGGNSLWMESERVMVLHRRGGRWRIEPKRDLLNPGARGFGMGDCPERRKK
jgi:acyl carrier protein phosphodiesterase